MEREAATEKTVEICASVEVAADEDEPGPGATGGDDVTASTSGEDDVGVSAAQAGVACHGQSSAMMMLINKKVIQKQR